jgi:hypothetical protein
MRITVKQRKHANHQGAHRQRKANRSSNHDPNTSTDATMPGSTNGIETAAMPRGSAQKHHRHEHGRHQPEGATAALRRPKPDCHHRANVIEAGERMRQSVGKTVGVAGNPRMGLRQRRQKKHRHQRNEARTKRGAWSELLHALLMTLPSGKVEPYFHFSAEIN